MKSYSRFTQISNSDETIGRVLLTRPRDKNDELAEFLSRQRIETLGRPMLEIVSVTSLTQQQQLVNLSRYDIVIVISANAIKFLENKVKVWPNNIDYYAIGAATAQQMLALGLLVKSPNQPITESLLELSSLQRLSARRILILRGVGGRELLFEQLTGRGAIVEHCEIYQRQPVNYEPLKELTSWKKAKIKTIVVTSGEILKNLLGLITKSSSSWLFDCNLVVPSQRVADLALEMGFMRCFVATGADNNAILQTLLNIQSRVNE
ncbi:MAG: uroporphyrinogen-III synthase [Gammaproteobacteria bacterium]|nr:uroporphyrinogen-III synthase [Gammaproteobacteria bacterium]